MSSSPDQHLLFHLFFFFHEALASADTFASERQKQQKCIFHEQAGEMSHVLEQGSFIIPFSRRNAEVAAPATAPRWEGQHQPLHFRECFIQSEKAGIVPPRPAASLPTKEHIATNKRKEHKDQEDVSSPNRWLNTRRQHAESGRACSPRSPRSVHY